MDENKLMMLFLSEELGTNDPKKILNYLKGLDESKQKALAQKYQLWKEARKKKQATKAAHGAKLNYVKSLKHICPEELELYYFKKGGNLECGCKGKKMEDGAKVEEAKCGAVAKFKKVKKALTGTEISKQKRDSASQAKTTSNFLFTVSGMKLGYDKAQQEKKKSSSKSREDKWKSGEIIVGKDIQRGNGGPNTTKQLDNAVPNEVIPSYERKSKNTGTVAKFKSAKCGSKMKKHKLGGSLNRIPFYLGGTPKGGITEKSDNTRVQRIPNNGEGVYEQIPVNGWNFVPVVGTLKEAKMLDQGDPNASVTRFGISLAGDLAGAGIIGSVAKAAGKVGRIQKALKARGYQLFTKDGSLWFRLPKKIIRGYGDKLYTYEIPNIYGGSSFKTIPTVDYTPAVMTPLVLTLRVPAEAPFFNYSK